MKVLIANLLSATFGENRTLIYVLAALVALDYITGVCLAVKQKQLSSKIGAKGLAMKVAIFSLVALSSLIDRFLIDDGNVLFSLTSLFYCTNEAISILENSKEMELPLPDKLVSILEKLKSKEK